MTHHSVMTSSLHIKKLPLSIKNLSVDIIVPEDRRILRCYLHIINSCGPRGTRSPPGNTVSASREAEASEARLYIKILRRYDFLVRLSELIEELAIVVI